MTEADKYTFSVIAKMIVQDEPAESIANEAIDMLKRKVRRSKDLQNYLILCADEEDVIEVEKFINHCLK